ncbi:DUF3465 domain-containing protein [Gammaproteobacteria bacterium]|nr:DUF3465 domain-containing protein [Gammaproteobacteria bacterium]
MKKLAILVVAVFLAQYAWQDFGTDKQPNIAQPDFGSATLSTTFERRQSNEQVQGQGEVLRVLSDDNDGSRHQRFILRLDSGQTLLIAHNIDLAPRISSLSTGDLVEFFGEYEWNSKGGVVHWTHHDPRGTHVDGWLKHGGNTYK